MKIHDHRGNLGDGGLEAITFAAFEEKIRGRGCLVGDMHGYAVSCVLVVIKFDYIYIYTCYNNL